MGSVGNFVPSCKEPLVSKLQEINVFISVEDLRARMSRGTFSAILFLQCLRAIGVTNLHLEESIFSI